MNLHCLSCGGPANDNWFDREICPEPCDAMHMRCRRCGSALDGCPHEIEKTVDRMTTANLPLCRVCNRELHLDEEAYEIEIRDIWVRNETVTVTDRVVFECLECGDKKAVS